MLVTDTRVATSDLPLAEFREHLRLGTGFSETDLQDSVLEGYLRASIAAIQARTGKILLSQDFTWTLLAWPGSDCVLFPVAPSVEILSLAARSADGSAQAYDPALFRVVPDTHRPQLRAQALSFPNVPSDATIEIKFRCGFGPSWQETPADLAQAVLLLAAHYYEFRHETALGEGCMPFGVTALLQAYKPLRVSLDSTS
ncbi:MAG: head-tail connector protein [Pseudomonadota bacterium]